MTILFKYIAGFLFVVLALIGIFTDDVIQWCATHGCYCTCVVAMSVILLLAGMLILSGKCDELISLCCFVSNDKLAKYNLPRLRLIAVLCLFLVGFIKIYSKQVDAALSANGRHAFLFALVVLGCLLFWGGPKWARKR